MIERVDGPFLPFIGGLDAAVAFPLPAIRCAAELCNSVWPVSVVVANQAPTGSGHQRNPPDCLFDPGKLHIGGPSFVL